MSVYYKFKSSATSDTIKLDGLHISIADLKQTICEQKRLGKGRDSELQIRNAETDELYSNDGTLIPRNTSLIVQRVPNSNFSKHNRNVPQTPEEILANYENYGAGLPKPLAFKADLAGDDPNATEEDRIRAMMIQSTLDYDPSRYVRIRGAGQHGPVPQGYVCHRCKRRGHWIRNCPYPDMETKRSTGIPASFLKKVEGPDVPGAMLTPTGEYAVMKTADEAYKEKKRDPPPFAALDDESEESKRRLQKENREPELVCPICDDYAKDAVKLPCCNQSFCDDCIRPKLIEEAVCPACNAIDMPPTALEPAGAERLRIRLIRAHATGIVGEADLRIGVGEESLPPPPSAPDDIQVLQDVDEDDEIQIIPTRRRQRRKGGARVPQRSDEVVEIGDAADVAELVVLDDDEGGSGAKGAKRRRRRKRVDEGTDDIVVL